MSHANTADKLLIRPTHGDRAGAGNGANKSHSRHPEGAGQFSGHASVTDTSLNPGAAEPVDPTLTFSFQPVLTRPWAQTVRNFWRLIDRRRCVRRPPWAYC